MIDRRGPVRMALQARQRLNISTTASVCPLDLADWLKVEVRYVSVATLEGLYVGGEVPTILVAADRPAGRQAMTIAHELAHHMRGDGWALHSYFGGDEQLINQPEVEQAASILAAHLIMPRTAILTGFLSRGFDPRKPSALEIATVASWLGVGFSSLVHQMAWGVSVLSADRARALLRVSPRDARCALLKAHSVEGQSVDAGMEVFVVDGAWQGRPVDMKTGDLAIVSRGSSLRGHAAILTGNVVVAKNPGLCQLSTPDGADPYFVRISNRGYAGLAKFRHLEAPDEDDLND